MKCPCCGQSIKDDSDIDMMAARSEYEAEVNRVAERIMKDEGIKCPVTACSLAMKRLKKDKET